MSEKFVNFSKFLLAATIWFVVFLFMERAILLLNWGFDILSYRHWQILSRHWQLGWKIDTFYEWAFMLLLLTFVPLYLASLSYIMHPEVLPKIKAFFKGIFVNKLTLKIYSLIVPAKKAEEEECEVGDEECEARLAAAKSNVEVPVEIQNMRQGEGQSYFNKNVAQEILVEEVKEEIKQERKEQKKHEENIDDILNRIQGFMEETDDKEEVEKVKKEIAAEVKKENPASIAEKFELPVQQVRNFAYEKQAQEFEEKGYYVIREKEYLAGLDFIAVSEQKIIFINFVTENASWIADEEFLGDSEPVWISSVDSVISPVYQTKQMADKAIAKIEKLGLSNKTYITILSLLNGNIQNEEEMMKVWKEKKIYVLNEDPASGLKKLSDFLKQEVTPVSGQVLDQIKDALK
ncbi:MAG: hypothetical protein LBR35_01350 [Rickettsiales bacterium]|jgi:hypothetical protein|nr:hypothetical protein [Rickettsiales bacterium]